MKTYITSYLEEQFDLGLYYLLNPIALRTAKTVYFLFETNGKLMVLGVPILLHIMLGSWKPKTIDFPFWTNGKFRVLGIPILKHIVLRTWKPKTIKFPFWTNGKLMVLGFG